MNTERRKVARNDFKKEYFELMKNSILGKTREIVRGCNEIELVPIEKQMKKIAAKPNFHRVIIWLQLTA